MTVEMIKRNYERGLWNEAMVSVAVEKGVMTEQQYEEITGTAYGETEKPGNV